MSAKRTMNMQDNKYTGQCTLTRQYWTEEPSGVKQDMCKLSMCFIKGKNQSQCL